MNQDVSAPSHAGASTPPGAEGAHTLALEELDAGLRRVVDSARIITSCANVDEFSRALLEEIAGSLSAAGGSIYFVREKTLECAYSLDAARVPEKLPLPLKQGSVFQRALSSKDMIYIQDISEAEGIGGSGWDGYINNSCVVFPLLDGHGEVVALVSLHDKARGGFTAHDCELGKIVASFGSEALRVLESAETLRESEGKLSRLMSNLPGMAYRRLHDEAWTMRFVSDGCASLTGYVPEAVIDNRGASYLDMIHPDDREWVISEVNQAVAAHRGFRITYRIHTASGDQKWVWEQGSPVIDSTGALRGLEGFITDVTEWKRAEDERSRLAMAIEQSVESVVIMDALGVIEYVNPAFEQHSGYGRDEALGKDLRFLYAGQEDERFFDEQWRCISQGEVWAGVVTNQHKDGTARKEQVSIAPVRDSTGNIVYFVATSKDITKESQLESHLRQAHKMEAIGELAAGIAHEINTPTQYIGDNIRFFQESFGDLRSLIDAYDKLAAVARADNMMETETAKIDAVIQKIDLEYLLEEVPIAIDQSLEGNQRVAEIIRAMREFAHPGTDENTGIDVNRAIKSTISVARNEWRYVADIECDLDPNLGLVPGHASSFNQVILNLIVNAAHAIADVIGANPTAKGAIRISTLDMGGTVEIRIQDSGTGIPDEIRARIFDPFFTTKQAGKGTGHGLAVAHSVIVEQHGGTIEVDSAPGKGTTFILRMPMNSDDEN